MGSFNRSDLEDMAKSLVDKFMNNNTALEDGILESAKDNLLNSEQIKRLTEMANTSAFLEMFKNTSGDDRMVEFKVADPGVVIKKYYSTTPDNAPAKGVMSIEIEELDPSDNDTSVFFDDIGGSDKYDKSEISDESDSDFSLEDIGLKAASYVEKVASVSLKSLDFKSDLNKFRRMDIENSLRDKLAHCDITATDIADSIAGNFKGIYSREKHAQFELDSISRHGNAAVPVLQMVRSRLGMQKIARALTDSEILTIQDRNIVEPSKLLDKVAEAIDVSAEFIKAERALYRIGVKNV
jgi:hypothetical protein